MKCSICIPQNEMVVLAGDMNGHVGSSNAGYGRRIVVIGMETEMQMAPDRHVQNNIIVYLADICTL